MRVKFLCSFMEENSQQLTTTKPLMILIHVILGEIFLNTYIFDAYKKVGFSFLRYVLISARPLNRFVMFCIS